jgi:general secretion pathway protein C
MAAAPQPRKPGAIGTTLVAVLTVVLAWQLVHWTWVLAVPEEARAPSMAAGSGVDLPAIARLFGVAGAQAGDALVLKGVVAPTPGVAASAIFGSRSGRDISVYIGGELAPGLKLSEVAPDHVVMSRNGVDERVDLAVAQPKAAAARPGSPSARGFHLDVSRTGDNSYALSRRQFDEALRDPAQLQYLGQIAMPRGGGVRMESAPPGSLAAKLGLRPGDVIRSVNGQQIASTGDLARLYQQFGTLSRIQAQVRRGSATLDLSYQIQ